MSLAKLLLLAWVPVVIYLFVLLPPRRAVLCAFIVGWLFLPVPIKGQSLSAHFTFSGLPNFEKGTVTTLCVLLGVLLFDSKRLLNFRYHWLDLPVTIFVLCPIASSLYNSEPTNQLGMYDGLSEAFRQFIVWGLPYLIGRVYFSDTQGMRDLAIAVCLGGLVYIPICWWEMRMSPSLHSNIFGYFPATFRMQKRYGGFRPMGFLPGGLSVGMWMTVAALTAFWLWVSGAVKRIQGIPMAWLFVPLFITALMSKATLAMILLVLGAGILMATKHFRTALPLIGLMLVIVLYMWVRSTNPSAGDRVVDLVEATINRERAQSLEFRFYNENLLAARALEQPVFGWGGWNRSRVFNNDGQDISTTDGLWIITLGQNGFVGLAALSATLLVPAITLMRWIPPKQWSEPQFAVPAVIAVVLVLHMADSLLNGFPNPVFMLMGGGLVGTLALGRRALLAQAATVPQVQTPARRPRRRRAGELSTPEPNAT